MLSDLNLALRQLTKSPGFTFVAIATLALCIGANSAIFSVINAVLLRPLPYPDAERLALVNNSYPGIGLDRAGVSIPDYLDRIERAPSIEDGALFTWESYNLAQEGAPQRLMGVRTTPSLFSTLQVSPALGRVYTETDAQPGNDRVVVISHALWQDTLGGADVLGESLRLNGEPYEIIGVMPASFAYPQTEIKVWVPFAFTPEQKSMSERGTEYSSMIVRLKPGATPDMLSAECDLIVQQNIEMAPQFRPWVESSGFTGIAESLFEMQVQEVRPMLWLLQAGVVTALLIGCANVANLLLTRASVRSREFAIRSSLGATRWALIRQLLAESMLLFLVGGALGLVVAMWGLAGMERWGITELPRGETISLDGSVFAFTLVCAGFTGLVFGLVPALQVSRTAASEALQSGHARTTATRRQRVLRNALVVGEIALSLMLVATAVLLTRSFQQLASQATGFDATSVLTARINLPESEYADDQARRNFATELETQLRALPGVESVGLSSLAPFGYGNSQGSYRIAGYEQAADAATPHGQIRTVSTGHFETLRIPLLRGRYFDSRDAGEAEQVVIVDQVMVDRYFPNEDPIGRQIFRGDREPTPQNVRTIVGVVAPVKHSGLDDQLRKETIYYPYAQRPVTGITLSLRTALPPSALVDAVRRTVLAVDADLPVYQFRTLAERIHSSLQRQRTPMVLLSLFGGMALLLAALGVYGTLAFTVGQRTQEMGIRMALGAVAGDVLGLIMRQGLGLIITGTALGLVGYFAAGRLLQHLLFEIQATDPFSVGLAVMVIAAIAALACFLPARRATKIDPMVALREE